MAKLILIRHGQSTWNAANKFSGWVDAPLNHLGRVESIKVAQKLSRYQIDLGFTSLLLRALGTTAICLTEVGRASTGKSPVLKHEADNPDCMAGITTKAILVRKSQFF